jgi:hypothetical protein
MIPALKKRFQLDAIRKTLEEYCASSRPNVVELKAVDDLILQTLHNWHLPTAHLVDSLESIFRSVLQHILEETAHKWETTNLFKALKRISQDVFLSTHIEDLRSNIVSRALRVELTKPITENKILTDLYIAEETAFYEGERFKVRSDIYFDALEIETGRAINQKDRERKRHANAEDLKAKLGPDPYKREIDVMAEIRAYYRIASVRFVDNIIQSVEAELFGKFREGLLDDLYNELKVTDAECKFIA